MSDLIEREPIIDRLNYVIEHGVANESGKHAISAEVVKEYIEILTPVEQRTERWIPVSERLPEVGVPVLTFDGKYMRVERHIDWIDADGERLKGEWWIDGTEGDNYNCVGLRDGTATHWMPLPEPYKESENE